jgi:hypothetical protein
MQSLAHSLYIDGNGANSNAGAIVDAHTSEPRKRDDIT